MSKKVKSPAETKLESILDEANNLSYFMMSVSHLLDVGYRNMTEDIVRETIEAIKAEEENPLAIMTKDFKVYLVETAYKISQAAQPLELVKFASKYINL